MDSFESQKSVCDNKIRRLKYVYYKYLEATVAVKIDPDLLYHNDGYLGFELVPVQCDDAEFFGSVHWPHVSLSWQCPPESVQIIKNTCFLNDTPDFLDLKFAEYGRGWNLLVNPDTKFFSFCKSLSLCACPTTDRFDFHVSGIVQAYWDN